MNRFKELLKRIGMTFIYFGGVGISWSAAYFLMNWIYGRVGRPSSEYLTQLIGVMVGIVILFMMALVTSKLFRGWERVFYKSIIEGLGRIAKGDFNVVLDNTKDYGDFGEIVESINVMASELSQMETMRQDFISNVSHEIQSPLTSIRGFALALQDETLSVKSRRHYLNIIVAESTRVSGLSDNLLKLSALESGNFPFENQIYRLDKQLRDTILASEPQWLEKNIEVEAELEEVNVSAVKDLMSQVWTNLLHNSIKFTPQNGYIHISLRMVDEQVEVEIQDSGIGISEEDLPRIFERFYKADKARTASGGGSGLGLSLVKKIVELHEGKVTVHSRPGEGTAFKVSLRVRKK
ncbi:MULTISPECIES: HAMP domain-containing sensor histidine kinase [Paenibacillus]|uniref:histidine kinase n=1 Tax=Paenibacillus odorifer TaxID=189426 RepID=A0A1R0WVB8_9BACL|nr:MULTISPECIES: HAMP domain-containing sensor histidine kinase [Paenibacillus]ETT59414.1 integral membrane sensor signal transduction histidine kinase [Paenibacillus sp. FSL H8-237]OMD00645.1 two-component sensor histidine kinase [Paenibacillus odorifer]OMD08301.1 two-component sensor histidine kinase [Paenibacillus odorifer]OMD12347.1 two-component sensor histidine kinase [Paenibacillus odorifer]OMD21945.1 two-component sensor histidine kinase [Paenibacillus odorifer]